MTLETKRILAELAVCVTQVALAAVGAAWQVHLGDKLLQAVMQIQADVEREFSDAWCREHPGAGRPTRNNP